MKTGKSIIISRAESEVKWFSDALQDAEEMACLFEQMTGMPRPQRTQSLINEVAKRKEEAEAKLRKFQAEMN